MSAFYDRYIKSQDRKFYLSIAKDLQIAAAMVANPAVASYLRSFAADLLIQALEA